MSSKLPCLCTSEQMYAHDCLPGCLFLQVLDLSANQLMRSGVLAVARALTSRSGPIELLSLDENAISENGVEQLREVLKVGVPDPVTWLHNTLSSSRL